MPVRKFLEFSASANHDDNPYDNPYGLGLVHSLYWPVFFKRNDSKFWLIFLEKFGMPTATGRIPGGKIDVPAECIKALQAIQADSAVVIPDDMTIELIEAARGGTADYTDLYERMDKAISKVVQSQAMTTEDGSSRSQAEVHSVPATSPAATSVPARLCATPARRAVGAARLMHHSTTIFPFEGHNK